MFTLYANVRVCCCSCTVVLLILNLMANWSYVNYSNLSLLPYCSCSLHYIHLNPLQISLCILYLSSVQFSFRGFCLQLSAKDQLWTLKFPNISQLFTALVPTLLLFSTHSMHTNSVIMNIEHWRCSIVNNKWLPWWDFFSMTVPRLSVNSLTFTDFT